MQHRSNGRQLRATGFTLIEVIVTLAIVALTVGIVIPAVSNITRASLRRSARGLSSIIRQSFDDAALTGQMQRIVFALGDVQSPHDAHGTPLPAVRMEASERPLSFGVAGGAFVVAAAQEDASLDVETSPFGDDDGSDLEHPGSEATHTEAVGRGGMRARAASNSSDRALGALARINNLAAGAAEDSFKQTGVFALAEDVRILDVWSEGMEQPASTGEVSLFFFPHGYTQNAAIHLQDKGRNVFTVTVQSLTGRTAVQDGYVERKP